MFIRKIILATFLLAFESGIAGDDGYKLDLQPWHKYAQYLGLASIFYSDPLSIGWVVVGRVGVFWSM